MYLFDPRCGYSFSHGVDAQFDKNAAIAVQIAKTEQYVTEQFVAEPGKTENSTSQRPVYKQKNRIHITLSSPGLAKPGAC